MGGAAVASKRGGGGGFVEFVRLAPGASLSFCLLFNSDSDFVYGLYSVGQLHAEIQVGYC